MPKLNGYLVPDLQTVKVLGAGSSAVRHKDNYDLIYEVFDLCNKYDENVQSFSFSYRNSGSIEIPSYDFRLKLSIQENEVRVDFQQSYYKGIDALERLLKLRKAVKDNFAFLRGNSIHKLLRGEGVEKGFGIPEADYINGLIAQSLKNRIANATNR